MVIFFYFQLKSIIKNETGIESWIIDKVLYILYVTAPDKKG